MGRLNKLILSQSKLLDKRNKLLAGPSTAKTLSQLQRISKTLEKVNANLINSGAQTAAQGLHNLSVAATVAGGAMYATMVKTQAAFSPGAVMRFNYAAGDLAAVVGSVLHPAFVNITKDIRWLADTIYNLSDSTKSNIAFLAEWSAKLALVAGSFWAVGKAISAVKAIAAGATAVFAGLAGGGAGSGMMGAMGLVGGAGLAAGLGRLGTGVGIGMAANNFLAGDNASGISSLLGLGAAKWGSKAGGALGKLGLGSAAVKLGTRWIPVVGWGLLAWDAWKIIQSAFGKGSGGGVLGEALRGGPKSSLGLDARREVRILNSVLEAGDIVRRDAMIQTAGGPKDLQVAMVAEQKQTNENLRQLIHVASTKVTDQVGPWEIDFDIR